jgi:hypothetical protein
VLSQAGFATADPPFALRAPARQARGRGDHGQRIAESPIRRPPAEPGVCIRFVVLQSHTATQQWQSFELRMRRRRVERCLLRASVAIEAGVLDDAREAIEEIRRLDPNEPGLEQLTAQLADAENPRAVEHVPPPQIPLAQLPPPQVRTPQIPLAQLPPPQLPLAPVALAPVPLAPVPKAQLPLSQVPLARVPLAQVPKAQPPPPSVPLPDPAPESAPARNHRFAAAVVLLACSAAGGWWWSGASGNAPAPLQVAATTPLLTDQPVADAPKAPSVRVSETSVAAPISAEPTLSSDAIATSGLATTEGVRPDVRAAEATELPASTVETSANARITPPEPVQESPLSGRIERPAVAERSNSSVALPPVAEPPPVAVSPPVTPARLEPLTGLPESSPPAPRVVAGAEGIGTPEAAARSAAALATPPATPAPEAAAARAEEQSVRAALGRYELAYNRLDAAAAASVWPGVNQRALASAFQGLSAQAISLGGCDIRVTGLTAHAECSGNARWTPKVGSGTQSARRHWRFDLRNSGGGWIITQATAR